VSTWLNGGVPPAQVAEWADHSVAVLLKVYAKCFDGQDELAKRRIEEALRDADEHDDMSSRVAANFGAYLARPAARRCIRLRATHNAKSESQSVSPAQGVWPLVSLSGQGRGRTADVPPSERTIGSRTQNHHQTTFAQLRRSDRVVRGGVEPPTFRFSGGRSYQLSYLTVPGAIPE
jgi:hypothetical protein